MKRKNKKVFAAFLSGITLLAMPFSTQAVQTSGVEYSCVLNSAVDTFIGNETPINAKDGDVSCIYSKISRYKEYNQ